jgi:bifunctional ADP-heptose synthase (sugar kinase/adenylyltransferase)
MIACGAEWSHAVRIANRAAGIVVGKLGTAMVSRDEIIQDMQ